MKILETDALLASVNEWVAIESPTPDRDGVNRVGALAERQLRDLGASIERIPGAPDFGDIVIGRIPGEMNGPGILLLGHMDTVHPVGTLAGPPPVRRGGGPAP